MVGRKGGEGKGRKEERNEMEKGRRMGGEWEKGRKTGETEEERNGKEKGK